MHTIDIKTKYDYLRENIAKHENVIIAFSGGVDSSLVLYVASKCVESNKITAITADSASLSRRELKSATDFAKLLKIPHVLIKTTEFEKHDYLENKGDRCYHCKTSLYEEIKKWINSTSNNSHPVILDGTNLDDLSESRPGAKAAKELGVLHPLVECELTKNDVREISTYLELNTADKPAMACLSSRVAVGDKVTTDKLSKIEAAEELLYASGFIGHRVRTHDLPNLNGNSILARIELQKEDLLSDVYKEKLQQLVPKIKNIGFDYVVLDLEGYKMGGVISSNSKLTVLS